MVNFKARRLLAFAVALCASMSLWVQAADEPSARRIVPLGVTVGMRLEPGGLLISKLDVVSVKGKNSCPARQAGLAAGDIIVSADDNPVRSVQQLQKHLDACSGEVNLGIMRDKTVFETAARPVKDENGRFRLGVMLKECVEGIGTLTYYDPEKGTFSGLGHGITDAGTLVGVESGHIYHAKIDSIKKGCRGTAGHMEGTLVSDCSLGTIKANCPQGIYGCDLAEQLTKNAKPLRVADRNEIKEGAAEILCSLDGETVHSYKVQIVRLNSGTDPVKEIELKVTDKELIDMSGGIVQGMSGSPIIQDGNFVGAVTHVLVNDPTRGYGIFIENMLEAADK